MFGCQESLLEQLYGALTDRLTNRLLTPFVHVQRDNIITFRQNYKARSSTGMRVHFDCLTGNH